MIDLTPFYDTDDIREQITAPFSDAEYTYATNGHILIRVPRRQDIAESPFAEKGVKLLSQYAIGENREWFDIPELPAAVIEPCDECEHGCSYCHGTGFIEKWKSIDVGEIPYMRRYLAMLAVLPDCKISPNGLNAAWFKFDGGDGLLMPMKRRVT